MAKDYSLYPQEWGLEITVQALADDQLLVSGAQWGKEVDLRPTRDVFLRYLSSVKSKFAQGDSGQDSPHLRFANAKTDQALIEFVREFGPVTAKKVLEIVQRLSEGESLRWDAIVDLPTLRSERRTYAAALGLMAELRRYERGTGSTAALQRSVSDIAEGVSLWPEQWESERQWRFLRDRKRPEWHFDCEKVDLLLRLKEDVFSSEEHFHPIGHLVLCTLVNAFATEVQYSGYGPVETLPLGSIRWGVRPALYLILKHLYLGGCGAQVCGNDRCRDFFDSVRAGQRFCTPECSQRYRQRKYWGEAGSDRRKQRIADKNKKMIKRRRRSQ